MQIKPIEYISFKKPLKETTNEVVKSIIDESLGAFDCQYHIAKKVAESAYLAIINDIDNIDVDVTSFGVKDIKKITVFITRNALWLNAQLINITSEGTVKIELNFKNSDRFIYDKEIIIDRIYSVIVHELAHSNIFFKRYNNNVENFEDIPQWYEVCQNTLKRNDVGDIYKEFAYALYSCYYQERQAIVSSTSAQLISYFRENGVHPEKDSFKKALMNTESFQTYVKNLYEVVPFIEKQLETNKSSFEKTIKKLGFDLNINKTLIFITNVSKQALKDVERNAMLFYYKNIENPTAYIPIKI